MADSEEDLQAKLLCWERSLSCKGLKMNATKTKIMVSGGKDRVEKKYQTAKWPCVKCCKGVGANSIQCNICNGWLHARCSKVKGRLTAAINYKCEKCLSASKYDGEDIPKCVDMHGTRLESVDSFCYLGDVIDSCGGVESAVVARIRCGWRKFRELQAFLTSKSPSMRVKGQLYAACVRQAMIYGCESWPLLANHERMLLSAEMRMIRWMCGVRRSERRSNEEMRQEMGLENILDSIRRQRLRWFGHVRRKSESEWVKKVTDMEVSGKRAVGRQRKTWRDVIAEDLKSVGAQEADTHDRQKWRSIIKRKSSNPASSGPQGRKKG